MYFTEINQSWTLGVGADQQLDSKIKIDYNEDIKLKIKSYDI